MIPLSSQSMIHFLPTSRIAAFNSLSFSREDPILLLFHVHSGQGICSVLTVQTLTRDDPILFANTLDCHASRSSLCTANIADEGSEQQLSKARCSERRLIALQVL